VLITTAHTTACDVTEKKEGRRRNRQRKEWERKKGERKEEQNAKGIKKLIMWVRDGDTLVIVFPEKLILSMR
jgi:hypothetical protein